jgi:hypothetical protein
MKKAMFKSTFSELSRDFCVRSQRGELQHDNNKGSPQQITHHARIKYYLFFMKVSKINQFFAVVILV